MAELKKEYKAKGVLTNADLKLTETKKEGILTHDLASALKNFEGLEVSITVSYKEEVTPVLDGEETDDEEEE